MQYGYFDDQKREYVLTNPRTPVKWINYIGTLAFGGFVDHTGGALICKGDPAFNRITKYIPQMPAADFKGEGLYLRIRRDREYQVFSPFFVPTLDAYDRFECHIGLGYTRLLTEFYGICSEAIFFVPAGGECELRDIRITNLTGASLEIDVIPVVEYTHPDALKQLTNADWVPQTMQSRVVEQAGGLKVLVQYPFMYRDLKINYFTTNLPASSFDTDRRVFLGENEYCGWADPFSLRQPELNNTQALRSDNIAALLHHLGTLQPGETRCLVTQLGQASNLEAAKYTIEKYRRTGEVEAAFVALGEFWEAYLAKFQVRTPDPNLQRMLNIHNPRQCFITKNWSRYLSLYQLGFGARGIGFRDSSQDVMGVMVHIPQEARELICKLLQVQKQDGSAMHQFNPLTMIATEGDSREAPEAPKYYSDDHLWIILAVTAYLKETGNLAFLDEIISYYEKDRHGQPLEAGSVLDHLKRAIEFTRSDVGAHGLPLLGFADWNDTVNLRRGAESLFAAHLYGKALLEMIDLFNFRGNKDLAEKYRVYYEEMRQRVNEAAWDGAWYVRYFDFDGNPLGSHTNTHGQIYLNGQSWAVISGFAPPERGRDVMDAVHAHLNTSKGIKLNAPGFDGFDPNKGGITTYPPGAKENGGIFLHTNPWAMIAEALLGNGQRAYEYYRQINPAAKNDCIDEFECEPYVYPQNILGDEHPRFGAARNSWLSGTASWVYQAATQYILGIQPTYIGLRIDPCIPPEWDGFEVEREFRHARYRIVVRNPRHVNMGVRELVVDGKRITGNLVPIFTDEQHHRVEANLGED